MLINAQLPHSLTWIMQKVDNAKGDVKSCPLKTGQTHCPCYFFRHWQPVCRGTLGHLLRALKEQTRRCLAMWNMFQM